MSSNMKLLWLTIGLLLLLILIEQQLAQRVDSLVFTFVIGAFAIVLVAVVAFARNRINPDGRGR